VRASGMWSCGPRATSPDAEGDPGPRALVSCGRGRPRSAFSQRHADEGRHPRQANASALRPTVGPGLRREDGERGTNFPPRHAGDVGAIARKLLVLANALVRDLVAYQKNSIST
jgi:hypothetical protein